MSVTVRTGAALKKLLGDRQGVEVDGVTVGELLERLGIHDRVCDATGVLRRHFNIHINDGEDIRLLQGLNTPVKSGDTVTILSAIAGGGSVARKVWLTFPAHLVKRPVIWELGKKFNVVTNIRQASVSQDIGVVGLELSGEEEEVANAIRFLSGLGIGVEPIELDVVE